MISIYILYILGECSNHRLLNQWPPVGKSSDTPKEVKIARREEIPQVLGKPAVMGRDMFLCKHAYQVI